MNERSELQEKAINYYCDSTKNEREVDEYICKILKLNGRFNYILPRITKFYDYIQSNTRLCKLILDLTIAGWWFIFFPIILFIKVLIFIFIKNKSGFIPANKVYFDQEIIVGTTPRIYEVIQRVSKEERPIIWLTVPWIRSIVPPGEIELKMFSLVTYSDIFWSIKTSWLGAKMFSIQSHNKEDCLQTYTAPEWFLVWRVINKIDSHIKLWWIANHQDRWAVLIDRVQSTEKKTVVVQHGLFQKDIKFPSLLNQVCKIYCFNQDSYDLFCKNYLVNSCKPIQKKISAKISLEPIVIPSNKKHSILIISQPLSIHKEVEITEYLLQNYPTISIWFKPHPLCSSFRHTYLEKIEDSSKISVNIISHNSFYPKVDLAITWNSTLGLEYEASGVTVVWFKDLSLENTIKNIVNGLQL